MEDMFDYGIEKEWNYRGYDCIVTYTSAGVIEDFRCGYVELKGNESIDINSIRCHGGVTFCGWHERLERALIGFDCMHFGDSPKVCTLDYCINQCEHIVDQIIKEAKKKNGVKD